MKWKDDVINGVFVESITQDRPTDLPPLVFVHGGLHGSWCWRFFMPYLAEQGWDSYALNWYNHYGSRDLKLEVFLERSIGDVMTEIGIVSDHLEGKQPIFIGHSMGGLASLKYASCHDVEGLVLLTPAIPEEIGGEPIDLPVDFDEPWGPPPFEQAYNLFFQGTDREVARLYYKLLCPESPQAVYEATRYTLNVDLDAIQVPSLLFAGGQDMLVFPEQVESLANAIDGKYIFLPDRSHNVLLEPEWEETVQIISKWLKKKFSC